jgi:cytochrome b6-f complex iron-sulfur subunit
MEHRIMTTHPSAPAEAQRSRLDPEPTTRRDFLGVAAAWSAAGAMLFALFGALRLPKAAVLPAPSRKFRVTLPESMAAGASLTPPGRSVAIVRDEQGIYAVSTVCTHLGCIVKSEADGFHCPCHGSRFGKDGSVVRGPAPRGLACLAVKKTGPGTYVVDEGTTVSPDTRETA